MAPVDIARLTLNSLLLTRTALMNRLLDPRGRDLDKECGYPIGNPSPALYWDLYERVGIANRVVGVYPSECWSVYPELFEKEDEIITPFEEKWAQLNKECHAWSFLDRVDELSGIGSFGILFLGLADGGDPSTPAPGIGEDGRAIEGVTAENELLFLRAFDQTAVTITRYQTDFNNPRHGQPLEYHIRIVNPVSGPFGAVDMDQDGQPGQSGSYTSTTLTVHWSRVIHVADNRKSSEVFGMPRMRPVLPEIMDIRKIRGGSAEMFWRGAFPGYSFETYPELGTEVELDKESVEEEFQKYSNGLQRFLALTGVSAKSLAPQIASPGAHLDEQYRSIGATMGVPLRTLLGAESGHLASTQDTGTWNRRLAKRQNIYLTPMLIHPFVDRLILLGVLPKVESYTVGWNDLNSMSAKDKADIALKRTQCMMTYVSGKVEKIMPVLEFYINILGLSVNEAVSILKKIKSKKRKTFTDGDGEPEVPKPQGGGRNFGDDQGAQGHPPTDGRGDPIRDPMPPIPADQNIGNEDDPTDEGDPSKEK